RAALRAPRGRLSVARGRLALKRRTLISTRGQLRSSFSPLFLSNERALVILSGASGMRAERWICFERSKDLPKNYSLDGFERRRASSRRISRNAIKKPIIPRSSTIPRDNRFFDCVARN